MTTSRRRTAETVLKKVLLFAPEYRDHVDLEAVRVYLKELLPRVDVTIEKPLLSRTSGAELNKISLDLARARVKDPTRVAQSFEPMYGEIEFEKRAARGNARLGGMVYDGRRLEDAFSMFLGERSGIEYSNIVVTQRLITTYSRDDLRHHLRTVVCGFPSIVSVPGIVEAPAKPREFHLLKQELDASGAGEFEIHKLKSAFRDKFVDYDSPELNEALKGIVLQAVVFHMTLEPFCKNPDCRLFNAHWQEELVRSQITGARLCRKHAKMFREWRTTPSLVW